MGTALSVPRRLETLSKACDHFCAASTVVSTCLFKIKSENVPLRILLALTAAWTASAQTPRFEDYPVPEIFKGTPTPPIIATPQQRLFRTRIREGVAKGDGVMRDGKEQPGPNFAGHYFVISWHCGAPCEMDPIVDAVTGRVYSPPLSQGLMVPQITPSGPDPCPQFGSAILEFRLNSKLMIVEANPDSPKGKRITGTISCGKTTDGNSSSESL